MVEAGCRGESGFLEKRVFPLTASMMMALLEEIFLFSLLVVAAVTKGPIRFFVLTLATAPRMTGDAPDELTVTFLLGFGVCRTIVLLGVVTVAVFSARHLLTSVRTGSVEAWTRVQEKKKLKKTSSEKKQAGRRVHIEEKCLVECIDGSCASSKYRGKTPPQ